MSPEDPIFDDFDDDPRTFSSAPQLASQTPPPERERAGCKKVSQKVPQKVSQ
jgi:hypothetical protein